MSTGSPSPLRRRVLFSRPIVVMIALWALVVLGAWVTYSSSRALRDDLNQTKGTVADLRGDFEAGSPQLRSDLGRLSEDSQALVKRLEEMESSLGTYDGQFRMLQERANEIESQRAVQQAKVAGLAAQAKSARARLGDLKKLQAGWTAQEASLLTGDPGRKIAASAQQLDLLMEVLDGERPAAEQIVQWELQLDALAAPIEEAASNSRSLISITDEHSRMLADLSQAVARTAAELEQQQQLVDAIRKETADLPAGDKPLELVVRERRAEAEKAEAERIAVIQQAARNEAEKQQAETLARLERELVEAKTKREQERIEALKAKDEELARLEQEKIAEERRLQEAQKRAEAEGLKAEVERVEEALRFAKLEREFEKDKADVAGLLSAFISPGFSYRADKTKGPMSYSLLKQALAPDRPSMEKLLWVATENDRPIGSLPRFNGGEAGWKLTNKAPVERAQELLRKYGDLLVKKGLLAP